MALATNAAFVTGVYQKSNTLFGVLQSTSGFSALCCFLLLPIFLKKISTFSIGIVAYSMMVLGALLIGASHEVIYYFIGYILILSFDGVFNVYIRSKRVEFISQSDFGKTIGVIVFANQLSMPLSGLFVRFFATAIGLHALFLAMAFVALLSSFCFIKLAPEYNLLTAKNFFRLKN
jgi:predicted MFS family arabinose efflux permease